MGNAVLIPCPTSGFLDMIVTLPSASTRIKAVGTNFAFGEVGAGGMDFGSPSAKTFVMGSAYNASKNPPPPMALARRKDLRPIKLEFPGAGCFNFNVVAIIFPYSFPARLWALCAGMFDWFCAITAAR
jgi:hypothetical protein